VLYRGYLEKSIDGLDSPTTTLAKAHHARHRAAGREGT
jgi:hypothetical protein